MPAAIAGAGVSGVQVTLIFHKQVVRGERLSQKLFDFGGAHCNHDRESVNYSVTWQGSIKVAQPA